MKNICKQHFWKCVHDTEKKKLFLRNFYIYIKETSENVCFYFMIGFLWSLYPDTIFLWCGNNKYLLELIKRRSKVQEKNMSCERALNFDQWKTFSENYKPMRIWLWLFTNLPRIIKPHDFSPSLFKPKRGILPHLTKYVS